MPFDLHNPIAWIGDDRLLISDVTRYGLRRKLVARKGEPMDVETWMGVAEKEAQGNPVQGWLVEVGEFYFLWIVWKETK
jgi:hypothetical protein